ncbi:AMP-binding protein [Actinokineospora soli]|uniref:AMP-binding protein n=1 Tax=Actinokineospora soli TaxID=1048753 RepID=A0ABW2TVR5_9PSEU
MVPAARPVRRLRPLAARPPGLPDDLASLLTRQLAFWTDALAGAPEQLDLPTDRPRPPVAAHHGATCAFTIPAELDTRLRDLAGRHQASLFMVLRAGLAALLTRLGAGTDVPIGSVVAGRTDESLTDLVGFFVNTLVFRTDTSGDPTFAELLDRVRRTDLAAFAHADVPFERLVDAVAPDRSLARHPLFQVMLILQNNAASTFGLPGLDVTMSRVDTGAARFDLAVELTETASGIEGLIEYRTDLFDAATVDAIATRYVRLLDAVTANPHTPIGAAPIMSSPEQSRVLVDWNATSPRPTPATVPALFAAQVAATPDAEAVRYESESLTYAELDARSTALAHHLRTLGAGPERFVAVAVPRSADMVVALLAVEKAGAAYLPIDPDYPQDRIAYMLDDARPVLTITTSPTTLPGDTPRLNLDAVQVEMVDAVGVELTPAHPAYLIYTSGSTGRPKGVVVTHTGVAALVATQRERLEVGPGARVLQFASPSFDAAFWEVAQALLTGATLVLAPAERLLPGAPLAEVLTEHAITHATIPPVALAAMSEVDVIRNGTLVSAGEACSAELVARWAPGRRMINAYGPTESTVCTSMSAPLTPSDLGPRSAAPSSAPATTSSTPHSAPSPGHPRRTLRSGRRPRPRLPRPTRPHRRPLRRRPLRRPRRPDVPHR